MALLRLIIYQPHAHYRIPFTYQRRHTYPLPPYSTIIGFLCNVCGIDDQNNELYKVIRESKFSILGKFEHKTTNMIWFRNLSKGAHCKIYGDIYIREKNAQIGHPGGQSPIKVDELENMEVIVHIYHENEDKLKKIKGKIENPENRLQPLHLGRTEDLIVFKDISVIEDNEIEYKRQDGRYPYFFWIPEKLFSLKNEYEINWNDFDGLLYLLTTFSKIENYEIHHNHTGKRIYEMIRAKLNDGKIINTKCLFDKELQLPIFLGDLNGKG